MLERNKYCDIILQEMLTDLWVPTPTKIWLFYFLSLWKWSEVKVTQSFPSLCDPMGYTVHGILQTRILEFPSPEDLPNSGIEPRSPTLQVDSLPAEPQGKPKNTGVGSLSFLQGIFPTQESNQGLLHFRQILYQLSYLALWVNNICLLIFSIVFWALEDIRIWILLVQFFPPLWMWVHSW